MTLKEAFLVIAEAFETSPPERTEKQKKITSMGLCHSVVYLERYTDLSPADKKVGIAKIREHVPEGKAYIWLTGGRENDLKRGALARKIAEGL